MIYPGNSSYPNASQSVGPRPELEPRYAVTLRLTLSAIICSIGVVGNILVVIITGANHGGKTAVHKYILNLAIADISVLAICYPLTLVKAADPENWPLGRFVCKFVYPFTDIFYSASIGSIVAIAMDRHTAIVRGMTAYRSRTIAKWAILAIWIASFMSSVFPVYLVMEYIENNGTVDCTPKWPSHTTFAAYVFSLTIFWYVIPLFLILWAYRQIACKIRDSKILHQKMHNMVGSYKRERKKKFETANTKALKILVPVVIVFAITMFPFHLFQVVRVFVDVGHMKYIWVVYNIFITLMLTNSAANPIIYSLVSEEFRQQFKNILNFKCQRLCLEPRKKHDASITYRYSLSVTAPPPNPDRETDV